MNYLYFLKILVGLALISIGLLILGLSMTHIPRDLPFKYYIYLGALTLIIIGTNILFNEKEKIPFFNFK